ncbi:hypothetical protein PR202_gb12818 [Eleusine coracana subsp. coracana]|uniref:Uncharacterized protein n=1 Tax=Eleusine coracana subsp. coracana TaxID=191504 RepID=A0AAV5ESJ2_ELECO|nr:hypothetical protein PR202_gb12818 [Eleusine coracana subsp. coracana]
MTPAFWSPSSLPVATRARALSSSVPHTPCSALLIPILLRLATLASSSSPRSHTACGAPPRPTRRRHHSPSRQSQSLVLPGHGDRDPRPARMGSNGKAESIKVIFHGTLDA